MKFYVRSPHDLILSFLLLLLAHYDVLDDAPLFGCKVRYIRKFRHPLYVYKKKFSFSSFFFLSFPITSSFFSKSDSIIIKRISVKLYRCRYFNNYQLKNCCQQHDDYNYFARAGYSETSHPPAGGLLDRVLELTQHPRRPPYKNFIIKILIF